MVAVSDTSPISNLSMIGCLDLLRSQFSQVLIPEAVRTELERMPNPEAKASIEGALQNGWLLGRAYRPGNRNSDRRSFDRRERRPRLRPAGRSCCARGTGCLDPSQVHGRNLFG